MPLVTAKCMATQEEKVLCGVVQANRSCRRSTKKKDMHVVSEIWGQLEVTQPSHLLGQPFVEGGGYGESKFTITVALLVNTLTAPREKEREVQL